MGDRTGGFAICYMLIVPVISTRASTVDMILKLRGKLGWEIINRLWLFVICYMFVCVVPSSHARARRKSTTDLSFILCFSNASDSLKVQNTSPEY